jgi:predicted  nucleic acid-binding Zn-ribbon protein
MLVGGRENRQMESEKSRLQVVLALLILSVVLSGCFWLGIFMNMNAAGQRGYSAWIIVIFISLASPIPLGFAKSMWDLDNNSPGNGEFNSGWWVACLVGHVIGLYSLYLIVAKYPRCLQGVLEREEKSRESRRLERKLKEADAGLERTNANIADLEKRKKGLARQAQALLDRNARAEMEIAKLTAIDPANLGLKVKELQKKVQGLSDALLRDTLTRVNRDLQEITHAKQRAREELATLESVAQEQEIRLRELERLIRALEMRDPSNIRLQVKVLSSEWRDLSESELEAVPMRNELSQLLKEVTILKLRIERTRGEIDAVRRRISDTITENVLTLEKLMVDKEQISRTPQPEKDQLSQIEAELQSLYVERRGLEQRRLEIMK